MPKYTISELTGLFSHLSLNAKRQPVKSFGQTRRGNQTLVYRLQEGNLALNI